MCVFVKIFYLKKLSAFHSQFFIITVFCLFLLKFSVLTNNRYSGSTNNYVDNIFIHAVIRFNFFLLLYLHFILYFSKDSRKPFSKPKRNLFVQRRDLLDILQVPEQIFISFFSLPFSRPSSSNKYKFCSKKI